jgi:hypothetical protein
MKGIWPTNNMIFQKQGAQWKVGFLPALWAGRGGGHTMTSNRFATMLTERCFMALWGAARCGIPGRHSRTDRLSVRPGRAVVGALAHPTPPPPQPTPAHITPPHRSHPQISFKITKTNRWTKTITKIHEKDHKQDVDKNNCLGSTRNFATWGGYQGGGVLIRGWDYST